tara:strand:- start:5179 stop:5661 length:483 start_codon:yes stop_codon:yes gene_type:complete
MIFSKFNFLSLIIAFIAFIIDRLTKNKIINYQLENSNQLYVTEFLNFELVWNTGIGFGLFNLDPGILYHVVTGIIILVILFVVFLIIKSDNTDKILYAMILGGALGNVYDRLIYFAVPDFIDFHIENYHWFTFNVADITISLGIITLLLRELIKDKNEKK